MSARALSAQAAQTVALLRRRLPPELVFLGAVTAAAALLRTVSLTEVPPGLQGDEAWSGLEAKRILEEGWIGIWTPVGWGQPTGPMYWTAFLFTFLPDDTATLRLSFAVFGFLTVPAFYLFAREFFGRRVAVLGTLLLALSFWHIHYSRTAFTLNAALPLQCLALFFMALGLRRDRLWFSLLGGIAIGLGVYTYRGNNVFLMALVPTWLLMAVLQRKKPLGLVLRHGIALWLPALLLAIPMIHLVLTRTSDYRGYVDVISIFNTQEFQRLDNPWEQFTFLLGEASRGIGIYFRGQSPDYTSGLGDYPILDRLTMVLFALGLGLSLWRWRDWRHFLILAGVASGVIMVAATVEWGASRRNISALPMVFAAAGLGGDWLIRSAEGLYRRLRDRESHWFYPAIAAATALAAVLNLPFYFREVGRSDIAKLAYAYELSAAVSYAKALPETPYVYFYSDRWAYDYEARRFQAPGIPGEDRSREFGWFSIDLDGGEGQPALFLLLGPYQGIADDLRSRYPRGRYFEKLDGDGRCLFGAYLVEPSVRASGWSE